MSYEIEDWHDLGDFARSRYLQPDEEEPEMSQPGIKKIEPETLQLRRIHEQDIDKRAAQFVSRERIYNPLNSLHRMNPLTEEQIVTRTYWDKKWEARSGASKRGWRKAHRNPNLSLMTPALIAFGIVVCLFFVAWRWL